MVSRERVLNAFDKKGYDRIPVKHEGTPEINKLIMDHFGLSCYEQVLKVTGDDFRYIEAVYNGPALRRYPDGSFEGWFGSHFKWTDFGEGRYLESASLPYKEVKTIEELDRSRFPKAEYFDFSTLKSQCEALSGEYAIVFGSAGDLSFINGIGRYRGQDQVLMDIIDENPVYMELVKERYKFYFELHKNALQAADGLIDIVHVGEDLGDQLGPMISPALFDKLLAPLYKEYFTMAHSYGARTMMHMCGCVDKFLPRLIEIGLDVYDVVQPTTPEMDIAVLQKNYGENLTFCGSVCAQTTLPYHSVQDVEKEVRRRLDLFPKGGLFLGPSHAIQVGTPLENILALYKTAGSLAETIDDSILNIKASEKKEINLFKLFG